MRDTKTITHPLFYIINTIASVQRHYIFIQNV